MNKLRQKHATGEGKDYGIDINDFYGIGNTFENYVWEPIVVKRNALAAAVEVIIYIYFIIIIYIFI